MVSDFVCNLLSFAWDWRNGPGLSQGTSTRMLLRKVNVLAVTVMIYIQRNNESHVSQVHQLHAPSSLGSRGNLCASWVSPCLMHEFSEISLLNSYPWICFETSLVCRSRNRFPEHCRFFWAKSICSMPIRFHSNVYILILLRLFFFCMQF